jgi:hypothetical protein
MRRDELMGPDLVSDILLLFVGTVIVLFLGSAAWLAILNY